MKKQVFKNIHLYFGQESLRALRGYIDPATKNQKTHPQTSTKKGQSKGGQRHTIAHNGVQPPLCRFPARQEKGLDG